MTYRYKNIILIQCFGSWDADYIKDGKRFALTRCCSRTRRQAYRIAKEEVDYLNKQEEMR